MASVFPIASTYFFETALRSMTTAFVAAAACFAAFASLARESETVFAELKLRRVSGVTRI